MGLLRYIPTTKNNAFPFLDEVDFPLFSMKLASLSLTKPGEQGAADAVPTDENPRAQFSRIVESQSRLNDLRMILASSGVDNAWIHGPKGIGKTTVVESLLRSRAEGRLTSQLMSKPFFIFDTNAFFTQQRGEDWVQKFDACLKAVAARNGVIIVEHIDDFVNTAKSESERLVSTLISNLEHNSGLKAIILSGESAVDPIRKLSTGVQRHFQELSLSKEPGNEELKPILIAHFARLEQIHKLDYTEEAADEIIRLLARYPGRAFTGARPENAIGFADKVGAFVRLNKYAEPPEIGEMRERLGRLRDEQTVLLIDGEKPGDRQDKVAEEIRVVTTAFDKRVAEWHQRFKPLTDAQNMLAKFDQNLAELRGKEKRTAAENQEFSLYTGAYDKAKAEVEKQEAALYKARPLVKAAHVRAVFSAESGISSATLSEDKLKHLANLDGYIDSRIYRQAEPKKRLTNAYFQRETGISDPSRPAGVFIFSGGTGVGKTELAKELAKFDGGEGAVPVIIRLNEFKGKEAGKRLTGADPGLVGYEDGSCLDSVKQNGRAIIVFDEAEKADPSVFDTLMQVLEEGKLTPSNSKEPIEFKDTIIVVTTNALKASELSAEELRDEAGIRKKMGEYINKDTHQIQWKQEFLGRVDGVFVFEDLHVEDHVAIFAKEIAKVNRDYSGRGISVNVAPEVAKELLKTYDDPTVGGRLARNVVSKHVRPLVTEYLKKNISAVMSEDVKFEAHLDVSFDGKALALNPLLNGKLEPTPPNRAPALGAGTQAPTV